MENYKLTSKKRQKHTYYCPFRLESPIKTQTARAVCLCEPAPCGLVGPDHAPVPFVSVWMVQTPLAVLGSCRKWEILWWIAAATTGTPPLNALISKLHPCTPVQQAPTHTRTTKGCPSVSLKREGRGGEGVSWRGGEYSEATANFVGHIFRSADNLCHWLVCFDKTTDRQQGRHCQLERVKVTRLCCANAGRRETQACWGVGYTGVCSLTVNGTDTHCRWRVGTLFFFFFSADWS